MKVYFSRTILPIHFTATMGRDSASGKAILVYGVKLVDDKSAQVNWLITKRRFKNFEYDKSLFAMAARAVPDKQANLKDDEMVPEAVAKRAHPATKKLLVMVGDELSEEEKNINDKAGFYGNDPREVAEDFAHEAIKQVLGEENDLALRLISARSGYEHYDKEFLPSVLILESTSLTCDLESLEPEVQALSLGPSLPVAKNTEKVNGQFKKVLSAFGIEDAPDPEWHLVLAVDCDPR